MNEVQQEADEIYDKADKRLIWQKPDEAYEAAALLIASQNNSHPLSPSDIATAMDVDKSDIHHAKRRICEELNINTMPTSALDYVDRFSDDLNVTDETRELAIGIAESSRDDTVGRAPSSVASAAVYAAGRATGEEVTQRKISNVSNVSEVTIRSLYRDMASRAGLEIDLPA